MAHPGEVFEKLKAARAEVADSPGALLHDELEGVGRSYRLFQANAREFLGFLERYDNDVTARLELWNPANRAGFEAFLDEVDRLLHNYLAAAVTLRDHTRRLWQQHPPTDPALRAEYETRAREAFAESPVVQFVQRLRVETAHRKLPAVRGSMTWTPEARDRSTVILSKETLLASDDWNVAARKYIESCSDQIDLRAVVNEYTAAVDEFNDWFGQAFVQWHFEAFRDLNERIASYNEMLRSSGLPLPEPGQG